jgi:hypothetical protein
MAELHVILVFWMPISLEKNEIRQCCGERMQDLKPESPVFKSQLRLLVAV